MDALENDPVLEQVVAAVRSGSRYQAISEELVRRVGARELIGGRSFKETVKATRNKLHQIGGAYQETPIPYPRLQDELAALPHNPADPGLQAFCRRVMLLHASTRERLPLLERFFGESLAELGPLHSVLDLACGLNPLALPWMPLAAGAKVYACDIYSDMIGFINRFFEHVGQAGEASLCDLLQGAPSTEVQLALVLKTIPCLEQVDKQIGLGLLDGLAADAILVSYPAYSLGGRSKGMVKNYADHFYQMVAGRPWTIRR